MTGLKKIFVSAAILTLSLTSCSPGSGEKMYVNPERSRGAFPLAQEGIVPPIYISSDDHPGIHRVAGLWQEDFKNVTGQKPDLVTEGVPDSDFAIIAGTYERNNLIQQLEEAGKIDLSTLKGKWESFIIQPVNNPFEGVKKALVIAGSDKRGCIYGMFDISAQMGVSPWYWWADVPVKKSRNLYVSRGIHSTNEPKVQYRGIFINDEAPALSGWAYEKFGGFNHEFYDHVFELILRLKGNFLWPTMWGRAFYDDDSLNPRLADEYGIVIGTSHHEPLMRAHDEWRRYGEGPWNYEKNPENLREFWREGMERMNGYESIVTIGMRGDGDEPMTEGTAIALLEKIVEDQREIISDVTGKSASETPQSWALYKEVLDYYDKGMDVPEDVMLLLCDDNWGNIRRLPAPEKRDREGGYGIYYHFDYVGGPRNYKWLNTNQIERTWEQMHLAYAYGARKLWLVNVGDIKPMEFPISFFLDYAWNPEEFPAADLPEYYTSWAAKQFGEKHAEEIGDILAKYTKYNSRRKPELLSPETYSLHNYNEAERIVEEYNRLVSKAEKIRDELPPEFQDAFFQLVMYPVKACANLNELYVTAAKNRLYRKQGRSETNDMAAKVEELFRRDSLITEKYHNLADGKWNHMASQTHIGYTGWQEPPGNTMPEVYRIDPKPGTSMGIAVEGTEEFYPHTDNEPSLPEYDVVNRQVHRLEIFNRGKEAFEFRISQSSDWINVYPEEGKVKDSQEIKVEIQWNDVPEGKHKVPLIISAGNGQEAEVMVSVNNSSFLNEQEINGFVENNGVISFEAENYMRSYAGDSAQWITIPNLGRTGSSVTSFPVTHAEQKPGGDSPHLEYDIFLFDSGEIKVDAYMSPTLNFRNEQGLRYALSVDDGEPIMVNMHATDDQNRWNSWVSNNINISSGTFNVETAGRHILKYWLVDPGVVLQKIVVEREGVKDSYLGP